MLPDSGEISELKRHAVYLADGESAPDPRALVAADAAGFRPWHEDLENSAPPVWLKLSLQAPDYARSDWVLLIKRRFFRQLDVYLPANEPDGYAHYSNGLNDYRPGDVSAQFFVYPLSLEPGQHATLLMRVETLQGSLSSLDFRIQDELSYKDGRATNMWAFGLYFGAVIALVFYNLVLYLSLRTPGHRLYVSAMTMLLLFMGMDSGLLQEVLPAWLRLREPLVAVFLNCLLLAAMIQFFQAFCGSRLIIPRTHRLLQVLAILLLLAGLVSIFVPVSAATIAGPISQLLVTLALFALLGGSLYAGIRGSSAGYIFFIAWSVFLMGGFIRSMLSLNVFSRTPITEYAVYIGSVMSAMILALGLSYRVGQLRVQRNRAVREQHRAMELANLDALTGAYNRRFFENYLEGMLASRERRSIRGALILLDIDDFKAANDTFGHEAGDLLLKTLTGRCLDELREGDVVCRLGGDEFVIVLHDLGGKDAVDVAERICRRVATNPVDYNGQLLKITVSIGVLGRLEPGMEIGEALRRADEALYEAKRCGRNRVAIHGVQADDEITSTAKG